MNTCVRVSPLILLCLAQFMVVLDVTVVNVALPSIGADLGVARDDLGLVVTVYTVVFGGLLIAGGRAADVLGARRTFAAGLAVFTLASLAAGMAWSGEVLLGARAAQGVGGALLSPAALSLLVAAYPSGPAHRRAFAAWGAMGALGVTAGVLLGGVLTDGLGWQAIFLVNLPVGAFVAVAAIGVLPAPAPGAARLALPSALLATASMIGLLIGITEGSDAAFAAAAAAALSLVAVERRSPAPLIPAAALRRRTTVAGLGLMLVAAGTMVSLFYLCSLYLQQELGHSPLRTGLEFLPLAVTVAIASQVGGRLLGRVGTRPLAAGGLALAAAGAALLGELEPAGGWAADVLPGTLLIAAGLGLAFVTLSVTAMAGAEASALGVLSAALTTAHELGASIMVAAVAVAAEPGEAFGRVAVVVACAAVAALALMRRDDIERSAVPALTH